ncbi:MAG: SH3 domain-containing protein [Lachnospiraceae bacterium]|nr:SH3 domain-containing protein [Lachnospiraceae bacterium]
MRKNGKKNISYAIAAGVLLGSVSMTSFASPVAGVVGMASTDSATVASNSYSTLSGVSLTMANILSDASAAADNTSDVASNNTTTVEQQAPESEYANVAIAQVDNYVNIRSTPSEDGDVVGKLYNKSAATVLATEGDWYQITSGNCTGYVKCEFVVVGDEELAKSVSTRLATVTTQTLYVREQPTTESSVEGMVPEGDDLVVTDESMADTGWVKVSLLEYEGYVSLEFVTLSTDYVTAESKEEEAARLAKEEAERKAAAAAAAASQRKASSGSYYTGGSSSYAAPSGAGGSAVVSYASQFVGNPYVYGGSSLTNGTDCSGFVMGVYSAFGVGLPHSSSAMRSVGYGVDVNSMQAGDIVCYSGHVGIYTGNGTIVNALNSSSGITYTNVNYSPILAVRRIY